MKNRKLWLAVGTEPAREVEEAALRSSWTSGVLPDSARVGESEAALAPIADVLGPRVGPPAKPGPWRAVVGVVVALAVIGGSATAGYTWWKNRPPPLCKATPNILHGLKANIAITYYVTRRVKKLDAKVPVIEHLLRAMKAESAGKLEYRIVDVSTEEAAHAAKEAGLQEAQYESGENGEGAPQPGYSGFAIAYQAEKDSIKILGADIDQQSAEFWLINKIRELAARADGTKKRIGVLTGHHEIALGDSNLVPSAMGSTVSMRGIVAQYFPFYTLVDVDLTHGDQPVDVDLDGLLVTQPLEELGATEVRRIDDFVMRGKALAVVASAGATRSGDATMQVTLGAHGLDKLLEGYGLELGNDLVFEPKSAFKATIGTVSGSHEVRYGFIPLVKDDAGLDAHSAIFFRMNEVAFPFASSITVHQDKQPGATFRVLARSTAEAQRDRRPTITIGGAAPTTGTGDAGSWPLAVTVEGPLRSAFGGAPGTGNARVLLVSSSAFFANPFARASGADAPKSPMGMMTMPPGGASDSPEAQLASPYAQMVITNGILALKSTLDWVTFDDGLSGCMPMVSPPEKTKKK